MPIDLREALRAAVLTLIGIVAIAAFVWQLSARYAHAGWKPEYAAADPAVQEWFARQRNALGQSCCNSADGHPYYGDYTIHADGSVTADGETIPKEKVLTGSNPTGTAVWWFIGSPERRTTYCFAPGGGA